MGMFDTVSVEGLFEKAEHNAVGFQTYSLESDFSDYVIRDGQLFKVFDGADALGGALPVPERVDFTGELNIYGTYKDRVGELWVAYDLTMRAGAVEAVAMQPLRYSRYHDLARFRPSEKPHATVSIDLGHASAEQWDRFGESRLAATLVAIREAIGDPDATVAVRTAPDFLWRHHVVQRLSDFHEMTRAVTEVQEPSARAMQFPIIIDEAGEFLAPSGAQLMRHSR